MPCPDCGAANYAGTLFCVACARPLTLGFAASSSAAVAAVAQGVPPVSTAVAAPLAVRPLRLVALENLQATGLALALPDTGYTGTLLVGRTDLAGGTVVDLDLAGAGGHAKRVSRRHAKLRYADGLVRLTDWESAHGTWLNKQRLGIGEERPLADGDEVRLADFVFRVEMR